MFFGVLKSFAGFFFFLNFGDDGAVADGHGHAVDGCFGAGGKEVGGVDRFVTVVGVCLGEFDLGDRAGDGDFGVGGFEGEGIELVCAVNFEMR